MSTIIRKYVLNAKVLEFPNSPMKMALSKSLERVICPGGASMNKNQIKIIIEGMDKDDGRVRASALINALREMLAPFSRADKSLSSTGKPTFHFNIVQIAYGSPLSAVLEQTIEDPSIDHREVVASRIFSLYRSVSDGSFGHNREDFSLIEPISSLTRLIGHQIKSARLQLNGDEIAVNEEFKARMDMELVKEERCMGYLRGMLEYINIHDGKNVFNIYPDIGPSKVSCHFPPEILDLAIHAIGKYVEVRGELIFKTVAKYAYAIAVQDLEIFPPDEQLPSPFDLNGAIPGLTDGLSSDEFIRRVRDGQLS